jgi:hypothetical protein
MEIVATGMNNILEEEIRILMSLSGMRVFVNLLRTNPALDFEQVLRPLEPHQDFQLIEDIKGMLTPSWSSSSGWTRMRMARALARKLIPSIRIADAV